MNNEGVLLFSEGEILMIKENKDWQMKCRLTQSQKEEILDYCKKHDMTISEFVRMACEKIFNQEAK